MKKERAESLASYLQEDEERTYNLLQLSAEDAVEKINADGFDFTVDELKAFGAIFQKAAVSADKEELNPDELDQIAGGGWYYDACRAAWNVGQLAGGAILRRYGYTPRYTWWN